MAVSNINGSIFYLSAVSTTIDTANSSAELNDVKYPIENVLDRIHPYRIFVSNTSTPTNFSVRFYVPPGTTVEGVFVDHMNVTGELLFKTISSGGTGTTQTPGQTATIKKDYRDGRNKCFVTFPNGGLYFDGTTKQRLYVGISTGSLGSIAGFTTVFLGAVSLYAPSSRIVYPGGYSNDIEISIVHPISEIKYDAGSSEYIDVGEKFIKISMPERTFLQETQEVDFFSIIESKIAPILFFENEANHSNAYVCKLDLTKDLKYDQQIRGKTFKSSISLVESI